MATASPFDAALRDVVLRLNAAMADLERDEERDRLCERIARGALGLTRSTEVALGIGRPQDGYERIFSVTDGSPATMTDEAAAQLLETAVEAAATGARRRGKMQVGGRKAMLGHELRAAGQVIGVLAATRPSEYGETEREAFTAFALHVASVLDRRAVRQRQYTYESALLDLRSKLEQHEGETVAAAETQRTVERVERAHELAVEVLLAVSSHAVSGLSLNDFYHRLGQTVGELVGAEKVLFWRVKDNVLSPIPGAYGIDHRFLDRLSPTPCTPQGDDLGSRVVYQDVIFRANESDATGEFRYVLERLGVNSSISVPWRAGTERLGLLAAYDSTRPDGFSREDTWVLQKAGIAAALVTQLWHTQEDLRKSVERLSKVDAARQMLLRNMTTVVEKERRRFVSELHDDALQRLTAAEMQLARVAPDGKLNPQALDALRGLLEQTEAALRRLVFEVHPPSLETADGLERSIRERLGMVASSGIEHDVEIDLPEDLNVEVRAMLFRQIAEAVGNVERHSRANRVKVSLTQGEGGVLGVVEDDGQGFVVAERSNLPGHLGLLALKERTLMAGGRYKIDSRPGAGTRVEFWIPLPA